MTDYPMPPEDPQANRKACRWTDRVMHQGQRWCRAHRHYEGEPLPGSTSRESA